MRRKIPMDGRPLSAWRDCRGAVAVEFALVVPAFTLLLLMVLELGLVLLTQSVLDDAAEDAARLVALGQASSESTFTAALCADAAPLVPCGSLQVNVQSATSFTTLDATVHTDGRGHFLTTGYVPGLADQSVLVQVGYNHPYVTGWVGRLLGNGNASLVVSSVAFRNEPF